LKKLLKLPRQGEGGFTLIEILVVVAILGILVAIVIPNIMHLRDEGREEAKMAEWHNIQIAVLTMMINAKVPELDGGHPPGIDELTEVHQVTATNNDTSTTYYLDDYLMGGKYPLLQAYDITPKGEVTIAD